MPMDGQPAPAPVQSRDRCLCREPRAQRRACDERAGLSLAGFKLTGAQSESRVTRTDRATVTASDGTAGPPPGGDRDRMRATVTVTAAAA